MRITAPLMFVALGLASCASSKPVVAESTPREDGEFIMETDGKAPKKKPSYTHDAKNEFARGLTALDAGKIDEARAIFEPLPRKYHYSQYAQLASLQIADIDYSRGEYEKAAAGYLAWVRANHYEPKSEEATALTLVVKTRMDIAACRKNKPEAECPADQHGVAGIAPRAPIPR